MSKPRALILGGGFAGLETAFLLRHRLHDDIDIRILSDSDHFLFRPNTIYIPFGLDADDLRIPLNEPAQRQGIDVVTARATEIESSGQVVRTEDGRDFGYDYLVIATGAAMRPAEIPGLSEHANTIWTPGDMKALGETIEQIVERAQRGTVTQLLFLIPPNNKCSGPLYELVFMIDTHLRRKEVRESVEITWASSEHSYIQAFGPKIHDSVTEEFIDRNIHGHLDWVVDRIEQDKVYFKNGAEKPYDFLVSFPPYVAAVDFKGLPSDDRGFLKTDPDSRAVVGHSNIFAPGDAGDFPVKQAFLAFLEADAAAEAIVGEIRSKAPRVTFDPVSMCVMEQFDKATFAQVPLQVTGDPQWPVKVRTGADGDYKVGSSPAWRLGKKMLGFYLPMRFRAGEPFHAGGAWRMMEVGLKGMSGLLSH